MIKVTIDISEDVISCMFTTAFEQGAVNYWCSHVDFEGKDAEFMGDAIVRELKDGKGILVWAYTADDGTEEESYFLTIENLTKGIQSYVTECEEGFTFDWDAIAADWILQHALFGDMIYG